MPKTQVCIRCGRELPANTDYFFQQKIGKLRTRCKECFGKSFTQKLKIKPGHRICKVCGRELPETEEYFTLRKDCPNPCFRGTCNECAKKKRSEHWFANKEKLSAEHKIYYIKNRDKILAQARQDRINNPEKYKEKAKLLWEKFKEKRKADNRRRWAENKEKHKQYRKDNAEHYKEHYRQYCQTPKGKEIVRKLAQKKKALKKSLLATLTIDDWHDSLLFFEHSCAYCGISDIQLQQDHVIPLSKGGYYVRSNIVPACPSCNSSKKARLVEVWYPEQSFFSEKRLKKVFKWTQLKPNSDIQQMSMF